MPIYKIDDIVVYDDTNFWLYIVDPKQYEIIMNNFENEILYLSSFHDYEINKNDIVMLYVRNRSNSSKTGIVGVLQSIYDMKKNDDIKVFNDKNLNRYIIETETFISLDLIQTKSFVNLIELSEFKKRINMTRKMIRDCMNF